jgi:hypothetical protein
MKKKKLPVFKTEEQERVFWAMESPLDYFDLSKDQKAVFPNLKPTLKSISIRNLHQSASDRQKVKV